MYKEFYWLNKKSRDFLKRGYLEEGQEAEDRIRQIADEAEKILKKKGFSDKFFSYMSKGWISLSSPIWSNFGKARGLPISCNQSYIPDTMYGILSKMAEVGAMTKNGAGTSAYFGDVRHRGSPISTGGNSSGPVHFMQLFDKVSSVVSQSSVRRGSFAAYLNVEHPDILEFLQIKDEGNPIQDISIGVCVGDKWMNEMIDGDEAKRKIWTRIIQKRFESGFPYLFFSDTANRNAPQVYKDKGLRIYSSNLCNEISLSSSESESYVCNLSSLNLLHYDEWKDSDVVETITYFLDAVMEEYINKVSKIKFMEPAHKFASSQRALGVGVLGWHSFLQSKMIPFESMQAKMLNVEIHKLIQEKTLSASRQMAKEYGEPDLLKGYGLRNATLMAIAPTTSSSFILGQISPSIEPLNSNYFVKDLAKGKFTYKNPFLKDLLAKHKKDDQEVWEDILKKGGSVQHLEFFNQEEKDVFKTFGEISQKEIVIQAAQRQKYIDQGQSLNLMISKDAPLKEVNSLMIDCWKLGIKGLYYQRGANPSQELSRSILKCSSCES